MIRGIGEGLDGSSFSLFSGERSIKDRVHLIELFMVFVIFCFIDLPGEFIEETVSVEF